MAKTDILKKLAAKENERLEKQLEATKKREEESLLNRKPFINTDIPKLEGYKDLFIYEIKSPNVLRDNETEEILEDAKLYEAVVNFKKWEKENTHTKMYLVTDNEDLFFSNEVFIQVYKALAKGLIDEKVIDEVISDFLNTTTPFNDDILALTDLKRKYQMLGALIEDKCNNVIKALQQKEDDLKDKFIESIRREETIRENVAVELSTVAKNTLSKFRKEFHATDSIYNVRYFAAWLKTKNYEKYLIFKEKWIERNKL